MIVATLSTAGASAAVSRITGVGNGPAVDVGARQGLAHTFIVVADLVGPAFGVAAAFDDGNALIVGTGLVGSAVSAISFVTGVGDGATLDTGARQRVTDAFIAHAALISPTMAIGAALYAGTAVTDTAQTIVADFTTLPQIAAITVGTATVDVGLLTISDPVVAGRLLADIVLTDSTQAVIVAFAAAPTITGRTIGPAAIDARLLAILDPVVTGGHHTGSVDAFTIGTIAVIVALFIAGPQVADLAGRTGDITAIEGNAGALVAALVFSAIIGTFTIFVTLPEVTGFVVRAVHAGTLGIDADTVLAGPGQAIAVDLASLAELAGLTIGPPAVDVRLLAIVDPVIAGGDHTGICVADLARL